MTRKHNNIAAFFLVAALAFTALGCGGANVPSPSNTAYKGGAVGAAVGGAAGALLDEDNRWRGGVIGGALGAVLGGAMGEISNSAAQQAAYQRQPVAYTNQAGTQRVEAYPYQRRGNCHIVKEKFYEHGNLVRETEREVCN
jgi:uncharacterized membrane protein